MTLALWLATAFAAGCVVAYRFCMWYCGGFIANLIDNGHLIIGKHTDLLDWYRKRGKDAET